jgi:hypothetical protein
MKMNSLQQQKKGNSRNDFKRWWDVKEIKRFENSKVSNAFNMDSSRIVQTNLESKEEIKKNSRKKKESWRNPRGRLEIKGLWIKLMFAWSWYQWTQDHFNWSNPFYLLFKKKKKKKRKKK